MTPGQRIGDYLVEDRLGKGGMGVVLRVVHVATGVRRALKVITEPQDPELALRFVREGEALAAVSDHPNVVRVHTAGRHEGQPYLVMELCTGGDLRDRVRAGPLAPRAAAALVAQVARGVAHANARGIVHRDLKPDNVLFDEAGAPRVVDFGVAQVAGQRTLTATGVIIGTPSYMAPEQADGRSVDARADVWGLGGILLTALTGRPPYEGASPLNVYTKLLREDPAWPSSAQAPAALQAILRRAMARAPEDRYPAADALALDLERFARDESTEAGSAARSSRRAALAALVALLAVAGLALAGAAASGLFDPPPAHPENPPAPDRPPRPRTPPRPPTITTPPAPTLEAAGPPSLPARPAAEYAVLGASSLAFRDDRWLLIGAGTGLYVLDVRSAAEPRSLTDARLEWPVISGDVVYAARSLVEEDPDAAQLWRYTLRFDRDAPSAGEGAEVVGPSGTRLAAHVKHLVADPAGLALMDANLNVARVTLPGRDTVLRPIDSFAGARSGLIAVAPGGGAIARVLGSDTSRSSLTLVSTTTWTHQTLEVDTEPHSVLFVSDDELVVGVTAMILRYRRERGAWSLVGPVLGADQLSPGVHAGPVVGLARRGRWLWSGSATGELALWDVADGYRPLGRAQIAARLRAVALSPTARVSSRRRRRRAPTTATSRCGSPGADGAQASQRRSRVHGVIAPGGTSRAGPAGRAVGVTTKRSSRRARASSASRGRPS